MAAAEGLPLVLLVQELREERVVLVRLLRRLLHALEQQPEPDEQPRRRLGLRGSQALQESGADLGSTRSSSLSKAYVEIRVCKTGTRGK